MAKSKNRTRKNEEFYILVSREQLKQMKKQKKQKDKTKSKKSGSQKASKGKKHFWEQSDYVTERGHAYRIIFEYKPKKDKWLYDICLRADGRWIGLKFSSLENRGGVTNDYFRQLLRDYAEWMDQDSEEHIEWLKREQGMA